MRGQRSIVAAVQYDLKPTDGGYTGSISAILWLDRIRLPNSKSSLSMDGQYSMERGLSGSGTLRFTSPAIGPKVRGSKVFAIFHIILMLNYEYIIGYVNKHFF